MYGGCIVSAAIDCWITISVTRSSSSSINGAPNDLVEAAMHYLRIPNQLAISCNSPVGYGTGLGWSGAFLVGLVHGLNHIHGKAVDPYTVAHTAFQIESSILNRPAGIQDPYVAAFGSVRRYQIERSGNVIVSRPASLYGYLSIENALQLFFTGIVRRSSKPLIEMLQFTDRLHQIHQLGRETWRLVNVGNVHTLSALTNYHWQIKRIYGGESHLDHIVESGIAAGASAGKISGAGKGGYACFICDDDYKQQLSDKMTSMGLVELPVRFTEEGCHVVR